MKKPPKTILYQLINGEWKPIAELVDTIAEEEYQDNRQMNKTLKAAKKLLK